MSPTPGSKPLAFAGEQPVLLQWGSGGCSVSRPAACTSQSFGVGSPCSRVLMPTEPTVTSIYILAGTEDAGKTRV